MSIRLKPENKLAEGIHEGFAYCVYHNGIGYRCGYVCIPVGHPWHHLGYDNIQADCHGGLTYADSDSETDDYWIGFDCAHSGDAQDPTLGARYMDHWTGGEIRSQEYVEQECRSLCEQAKAQIT